MEDETNGKILALAKAAADTALALAQKDIKYLQDAEKNFVTRNEFTPVRNIAYGLVGLVGLLLVSLIAAKIFGIVNI